MADLISRAAAIEYLMTNMGWHDEDGYAVDDADEKRAIITDLVNGIPAVVAIPVEWLKAQINEAVNDNETELASDIDWLIRRYIDEQEAR